MRGNINLHTWNVHLNRGTSALTVAEIRRVVRVLAATHLLRTVELSWYLMAEGCRVCWVRCTLTGEAHGQFCPMGPCVLRLFDNYTFFLLTRGVNSECYDH